LANGENKAIKIHDGERISGLDSFFSGLTFISAIGSKMRYSAKTSNPFRITVLLSGNIKNNTDDVTRGTSLKWQLAYSTFAREVLCDTQHNGLLPSLLMRA